MPNVHFGRDLELALEAFQREVLEVELPWRHQEWTLSAKVKLLLRAGLEAYAAPLAPAVICVPFQLQLGGEGPIVLVPNLRPFSLVVPLTPYPCFRLRGLLYEEIDGDAVAFAQGLGVGTDVLTGFGSPVPLSELAHGRLDLDIEVRYPKRLRVQVSALPGGAARGRGARELHDQVAFCLHALISPLPLSFGDQP